MLGRAAPRRFACAGLASQAIRGAERRARTPCGGPGRHPCDGVRRGLNRGRARAAARHGRVRPRPPGWLETVDLHPDAAREMEHLLNGAARLLEQWGSRPPALVPVVDTPDGDRAFRVYLVEDLVGAFGFESGSSGVFHRSLCGGIIMLSAGAVLSNGRLSDRGAFTVVHELFHAVQRGSPYFGRRGRACDRTGGVTDGFRFGRRWVGATARVPAVRLRSQRRVRFQPRPVVRLPAPQGLDSHPHRRGIASDETSSDIVVAPAAMVRRRP
jgi:hypothetical protein